MSKPLSVSLSDEQRDQLRQMTRSGSAPARVQTRARILLLADRSQGTRQTHQQITDALGVSGVTVSAICRRFVLQGLDAALYEKPRPGQAPKITGEVEAQLVLLACSDPPQGQARWTMQMLADKLVELQLVESISDSTVCERLKNDLKPWKVARFCIGTPSAGFVAKMEDVLSVYARPYDADRPVVCVDEARKELRSTPRGNLPPKTGKNKREDYEYEREGWANLFVAVEPLAGRRQVQVTDRRTACDFAQFLRTVSDALYPKAQRIVLVTDNLNTHKAACFYEAFAPEEAFRLAQRFEWHYTPEHGSWLNIAEIELSVLERQCLKRRMNRAQLEQEVPEWEARRNLMQGKIDWQFTVADARVKLRRLYPKL